MPQPLTEVEAEIVLRLLARISIAIDIQRGDVATWNTPVPTNPELPSPLKDSWPYLASELAIAGAHHLAITMFRDSLLKDKEPDSARNIAIAALLWEERDLAEEWALRSLEKLEAEIESGSEVSHWRGRAMEILKLAKVFRTLGRLEEEVLLRRRFNEIMPGEQIPDDPGMDALRLSVELGYEEETAALALKLVPLSVGHSRGYLTLRLFRTLLAHGKQSLAHSLFTTDTESHHESSLRHSAIEAACEREDFSLALLFAAHPGFVEMDDWPYLVMIAKWLIGEGRIQDWQEIWAMATEKKHGLSHMFSIATRLKFLATLVEHVVAEERATIFKISNKYYQAATKEEANKESGHEIANYHLVIAAWGASKNTVHKLSKVAKIPKHRVGSMIRAAAERGLPFLLDLVPEAQSTFLIKDTLTGLRFEWERKQRGKRHRFEKVYQETLQKALVIQDEGTLRTIIRFVGTTWKDLDRYRELLEKYPSPLGLSFVAIWPFTKPYIHAGDLIGFDAELSKIDDAHCLSEISGDLYRCLKHRFGIKEQVEDF